jgi:delta 1-pyrroline-5-carboxylate dehydrogenase
MDRKVRAALAKTNHLQSSELDTGPRPSTRQLENPYIPANSGGFLTETQKRKFRRARRAARNHEATFNTKRAEERAKLAASAEPLQPPPVKEPIKPRRPLADKITTVRGITTLKN